MTFFTGKYAFEKRQFDLFGGEKCQLANPVVNID